MRDTKRRIYICDSCKEEVSEKSVRYVPTVKDGKLAFLDCCTSCSNIFSGFMGIKS